MEKDDAAYVAIVFFEYHFNHSDKEYKKWRIFLTFLNNIPKIFFSTSVKVENAVE